MNDKCCFDNHSLDGCEQVVCRHHYTEDRFRLIDRNSKIVNKLANTISDMANEITGIMDILNRKCPEAYKEACTFVDSLPKGEPIVKDIETEIKEIFHFPLMVYTQKFYNDNKPMWEYVIKQIRAYIDEFENNPKGFT